MRHTMRWAGLGLAAVMLTGCATTPYYDSSPRYYSSVDSYERDRVRQVYYGEVVDVVERRVGTRRSGHGAVLGAVIGGVLGNQIGSGSGRAAATLGGAIAGGAVGDRIERDGQRGVYALEVTVRLNGGQLVSVLQPVSRDFRPGDRVRIVGWGDEARVEYD